VLQKKKERKKQRKKDKEPEDWALWGTSAIPTMLEVWAGRSRSETSSRQKCKTLSVE
jgi:hypothetical protein